MSFNDMQILAYSFNSLYMLLVHNIFPHGVRSTLVAFCFICNLLFETMGIGSTRELCTILSQTGHKFPRTFPLQHCDNAQTCPFKGPSPLLCAIVCCLTSLITTHGSFRWGITRGKLCGLWFRFQVRRWSLAVRSTVLLSSQIAMWLFVWFSVALHPQKP